MKELLNKDTVKRVDKCLKKFNSNLNIIVLDSKERTAKYASNSLNCELGAIIKSLVFIAEDNFLVCLVSGDKKCSLNKLKKLLNKKNVFMANADQVKENTGFSIGGVAPIGHLKKLNIIVDKSLNRFKYIYGAAGHPDCVFKITYSDLIKITTGSEKDITEWENLKL